MNNKLPEVIYVNSGLIAYRTTHIHEEHTKYLRADTVVDKELVTELLNKLYPAIVEYWDYKHSGDPWEEDAREMGEMSLDILKRDRKEISELIESLTVEASND